MTSSDFEAFCPNARTRGPRAALAVGLLCALLAPASARAATRIGVTSAVNPDASGQPPGLETRVLRVGVDNFADERITTGTAGQVQLLFLDGSSLSIGPNAEVAIDRFAYDEHSRLGELKLAATSGVLRFVGGSISKTSTVDITTPAATVGIRGGIVLVDIQPGKPLVASFLYGEQMTVSAAGATETVRRAGYSVSVVPGQAPSSPTPVAPTQLRADIAAFEGAKHAEPAGAAEPAPDAALASSNLAAVVNTTQLAEKIVADAATSIRATEDEATEVIERVQEPRIGADYRKFVSIYDYLGHDLTVLPRANSDGQLADHLWFGYVGGIVTTTRNGETSSAAIAADSGAVVALDAQRYRVTAGFSVDAGAVGTFDLGFGGVAAADRGRSILLADNIFAARDSASIPSVLSTGGQTIPLTAEAIMVTAAALDITVPGATLCSCRYLTWGWWVGIYQQPNGTVSTVNLGSWVVGRVPDLSEIPQVGTATYNGQAIGNVVNAAGVHYLAGGSFQQVWNFAQQSGTATIGNFDGITLQGASSSANGREYTGSLASAGGNFTGSFAGTFFGSAVHPVAETGGTFNFSSAAGYQAGGTFAAKR